MSTLRTPLAKVRGLGSAKEGADHFWLSRVTAVANIVLVCFLIGLIVRLVGKDYATVKAALAHPFVSIGLLLLILSGTIHMRLGMQTIIEDYVPEMESWYCDLQNAGSAEGSLIKSGLFLREFASVPWAHLDIAGTAYYRKATPFAPRGATGVSHATLVELALAGARAG